jgi:hypothetical protein
LKVKLDIIYLVLTWLDREWSLGERRAADNTSRNEIRPLFALVKLAPPLQKHYYIQLNLFNKKPLMSCLFTGCIKKTVIELQRAIVPELQGV